MCVRRRIDRALIAAGLALALGGCNAPDGRPPDTRAREAVGLFTTLPIYWGEVRDITAMLDEQQEPHWARKALEERYRLVPLDVVDDRTLAPLAGLVLAQPRALAPAENVALDRWVREGGTVLILADPMLVQESVFPIGDKRRPQDVVLLSPILSRWGLDLRFDETQGEAERTIAGSGFAIPVAMAGTLALRTPAAGQGRCAITAQGLIARCRIGQGRAVVVADADLLDRRREGAPTREALSYLTGLAFGA